MTKSTNPFVPTHVVSHNGNAIPVRADLDARGHGPLYTREEWDAAESADWELTEEGLLFQGKVPIGESSYRAINSRKGAEKKFEARFEGPSNRGLRERIRRVVRAASPSCPARAAAVRALASKIALTARGKETLERVARDYDPKP